MSARWFVSSVKSLAYNEEWLRGKTVQLKADHVNNIYTVCKNLNEQLIKLDTPATSAALSKLKLEMEKGVVTPRLQQLLDNYSSNFLAELKDKWLLLLTARESTIIDGAGEPFGPEVKAALPELGEDLHEAALCLGLGRHVACVFHLMRATELCVGRISHALSGVTAQKNWGFLLSDIKCAVDAMPKGEEKSAWLQAHLLLFGVKEAWRNNVMHPNQTYTQSEAEDVYRATGLFLRHLASLLHPAGPAQKA